MTSNTSVTIVYNDVRDERDSDIQLQSRERQEHHLSLRLFQVLYRK